MTEATKGIDFFSEAADGVSFIDGGLSAAAGISSAGTHAGFRKNSSKPDLALVIAPEGAVATGMFTTNRFCAAPVALCRSRLAAGRRFRAIVLNSGNANATTGDIGARNAERTAEIVASELGIGAEEVLVASTGVIGVQLDMERFEIGIPQVVSLLGDDAESAHAAARAIMTTDTVPKEAAVAFEVGLEDGTRVSCHIGGMAKGSGMIEPNMATMLSVLATDVPLSPDAADEALSRAVAKSFNRVTVDSDTSTNDSVFLLATGKATPDEALCIEPGTEAFETLCSALDSVCVSLARQIAADGEGATKLVTVRVTGAASDSDAYLAAKSIANSPLVKTAIAGHDANWGRLAMALGKSDARFNQDDVSISLMGIDVCRGGLPLEFDEEEALRRFELPEIDIWADLGCGEGASRVWTCDLTHDYISINADYRT